MITIRFPEWPQVLAQAQLPGLFRRSAEITIRWYLSLYRRARVEVTVQSARDFIEWITREKHPEAWQLEDRKEGIRCFFRAAKDQELERAPCGPWVPLESSTWLEWKVAFLTTLRRRRYSYRTEESYAVWVEQFARFLGTDDVRAQGE